MSDLVTTFLGGFFAFIFIGVALLKKRRTAFKAGVSSALTRLGMLAAKTRKDLKGVISDDDVLEVSFEVLLTSVDIVSSGYDGHVRQRLIDLVYLTANDDQLLFAQEWVAKAVSDEVKWIVANSDKSVSECTLDVVQTVRDAFFSSSQGNVK